ncbi:hypothetical protein PI172_2509 [Prevotella intermedia]|uniref:Uncharacterized protein n=1 Tax=Prevotella intermedia TaxID=28131 RepID=A0AAD1F8Q5_PREIN|nr:hypothetical protein PI172_2509 [Prevotella intermedia]
MSYGMAHSGMLALFSLQIILAEGYRLWKQRKGLKPAKCGFSPFCLSIERRN